MLKCTLPLFLEWRVAAPTVYLRPLDKQPINIGTVDRERDVALTPCVQIRGGQRAWQNQSARSNEQRFSQSRASTTGKR